MKIIKQPDEYDMNLQKDNEEFKKSCTCPFCGNSYFDEQSGLVTSSSYDVDRIKGEKIRDTIYNAFALKWFYKIYTFRCYKCGAEWESDPVKIMRES